MMTFTFYQGIFITLAILSAVNASGLIAKRTQRVRKPSCVDFTPFAYCGCFRDDSSPRALIYTSNLDFKTMAVEECVAFCKGNGYKYAGLEYYGECFCGASVNSMQIDESSCNLPCNGNQTESCGGNEAISIYQDPTFPVVDKTTIADYMAMGCYSEGPIGRTLAWKQNDGIGNTLTVERCLFACKAGGYAFAGVEFGRECYCGVVLGNGTLRLDPSECDIRCAGDKTQFCGGHAKLNLYVARTLESTKPCGFVPGLNSSIKSSPTPVSSNPIGLSTPVVFTKHSSSSPTTSSQGPLSSTSLLSSLSGSPSSTPSPSPTTPLTAPSITPSSSASIILPTPFTTTPRTTPQRSSSTNSSELSSTSMAPINSSQSPLPSSSTPSFLLTSSTTPLSSLTTNPSSTTSSSTTTSLNLSSSPTSFRSLSTSTVIFSPSPTIPAASTTSSICTSLYTIYPPLPIPACEYKLGKWCAKPISEFSDSFTCLKSFTSCVSQLSACFRDAGYPENLHCNKFNLWCSRIADFCDDFCPGPRCSVTSCRQVVLPYGVPSLPTFLPGILYTTSFSCLLLELSSTPPPLSPVIITTRSPMTTSARQGQLSTTSLPIPTYTNICTQPSNPSKGYGPYYPVGGFPLPNLSCNNELSDYNSGHPFKLYTSSDSSKCPSYERAGDYGPSKGCLEACNEQYMLCTRGYADPYKGYKKFKRGNTEDYYIATKRCTNQRDDCHYANRGVSVGSKCGTFNSGY